MTTWHPAAVWVFAFLLGAFVPTLIVVGLLGPVGLLTFPLAVGHAVLLGLPVALFYRHRRWTNPLAAIAGGFLIGALPMGVFRVLANPQSSLLAYLEFAASSGLLGATGAMTFWLILKWAGALR